MQEQQRTADTVQDTSDNHPSAELTSLELNRVCQRTGDRHAEDLDHCCDRRNRCCQCHAETRYVCEVEREVVGDISQEEVHTELSETIPIP